MILKPLGTLYLASLVGASVALAANAQQGAEMSRGSLVRASAAGARLDSHLLKGGGTDDTQALQRILDQAAQGTPVHLIIDGAALVSGLDAVNDNCFVPRRQSRCHI